MTGQTAQSVGGGWHTEVMDHEVTMRRWDLVFHVGCTALIFVRLVMTGVRITKESVVLQGFIRRRTVPAKSTTAVYFSYSPARAVGARLARPVHRLQLVLRSGATVTATILPHTGLRRRTSRIEDKMRNLGYTVRPFV